MAGLVPAIHVLLGRQDVDARPKAGHDGWRQVGAVIYKDLRGFIKQVDELGALRRVNGADPRFELGGITEVAARPAEGAALAADRRELDRPVHRPTTHRRMQARLAALALARAHPALVDVHTR